MLYTPLMAIASFGFLAIIRKTERRLLLPIFLGMAALVYAVFSWEQWYYGAGFGARALIEAMPLMAIPLATLIHAASAMNVVPRFALHALIVVIVLLNLFQSYQYASGVIAARHMNRAYYWRVFGKLEVTAEEKKLLH